MFDVFYHGPKPNLFAHERPATTLEQARRKSHTRFFWYIDGSKDLREFDFTWCVAPWEQHQTHIFLLNSQFEAFSVVFAPTDDLPVVEHYHERQYLPRRYRPRARLRLEARLYDTPPLEVRARLQSENSVILNSNRVRFRERQLG